MISCCLRRQTFGALQQNPEAFNPCTYHVKMAQPSAFLALLVDMHKMIYEHMLEPHLHISTKRTRTQHQHPIPCRSGLILASPQIHDEFYPVFLYHAFTTADALVARVKNFDFRFLSKFLSACADSQLAALRTINPPKLVAGLCFCPHFRALMHGDYQTVYLGTWLKHRMDQPAAIRIPLLTRSATSR